MSELATWEARVASGKGRVRPECTIAPNTVARRIAGEGIVVTFHGTDILSFREDGLTEILTDYNSYTTRERLNRYTPGGWHVYQYQNKGWVGHTGSVLMLPMVAGTMLGWNVTSEVEEMALGVRLGKADAREALAAWFEAKGWSAMADAVRNLPSKPYGYGTKALRALYAPCTIHEDCAKHPDLGAACKKAQREQAA